MTSTATTGLASRVLSRMCVAAETATPGVLNNEIPQRILAIDPVLSGQTDSTDVLDNVPSPTPDDSTPSPTPSDVNAPFPYSRSLTADGVYDVEGLVQIYIRGSDMTQYKIMKIPAVTVVGERFDLPVETIEDTVNVRALNRHNSIVQGHESM